MTVSWAKRLIDTCKASWPRLRKVAVAVFVVIVLALLGYAITKVQWAQVLDAISKMSGATLWLAAGITLASYLVYSTYDLLGKWYTDHGLAWWRVIMVGMISYAFTMSLGAPVGGLAMRLRLYVKQGLEQGTVMRILGISITSNWMGYLLVAGAIFAMGVMRLPRSWEFGNGSLQAVGMAMVVAGLTYLYLCAFSKTRSWTIHGHVIELPSIGLAAAQISLAIVNWMLIAGVIYVLLEEKADYFVVLGIFLVSAIAGAIAHVPGGVGVIESVFIALLPGNVPHNEILGAVLVYRAFYYVAPLLIAGAWYLAVEAKMSRPADFPESNHGAEGPPGIERVVIARPKDHRGAFLRDEDAVDADPIAASKRGSRPA
jgi:uncharacterized membrane protein YbhN (UPF0104 family)